MIRVYRGHKAVGKLVIKYLFIIYLDVVGELKLNLELQVSCNVIYNRQPNRNFVRLGQSYKVSEVNKS